MAVARESAATAITSPTRLARPTISWSDRLCFAKAWMDGSAWRGGAYVARGHAALNAPRQASARGYARGRRTNPITRRCARGHSRSFGQQPCTSGRAQGRPVRSGANAVRAGYPKVRVPTGEKGGASHINANRKKNPRIRPQKLTVRHPRSAHAAG